MKLGKKSYIIGGGALFLITVMLLTGLFTGCGPKRFCERGFHKRFSHKNFSEHILKRFDSRIQKLGLSDAQQEKYKKIREKVKANLESGRTEREKLFSELRTEINRENPDIDTVTGILKRGLRDLPGFMEQNLDYGVELYEILNPEQKAKVLEHMREKMDRCPGRAGSSSGSAGDFQSPGIS
jgi:Spy/CpxP family protein refolding chaperone